MSIQDIPWILGLLFAISAIAYTIYVFFHETSKVIDIYFPRLVSDALNEGLTEDDIINYSIPKQEREAKK